MAYGVLSDDVGAIGLEIVALVRCTGRLMAPPHVVVDGSRRNGIRCARAEAQADGAGPRSGCTRQLMAYGLCVVDMIMLRLRVMTLVLALAIPDG